MERRQARLAGALAWLFPLGVYAVSLQRTVGYWDTGEMAVVPWILGIAHSTGFPFFTVAAWAFAHALPVGTVAARISLFCALAMTLGAWLIARIVIETTGRAWIAMGCAWLFAFGDIAWTRGTRPEVHALALLLAVTTIFFALRWYRTGEARWMSAGALAWGLGIATHPIDALLLPGLLVLVLSRLRMLRWRSIAWALAAFAVGIGFYAYLPLRSAWVNRARLDPTLTLGEPPGKPFWNNDDPATLRGFLTLVSGAEFGAGGTLVRMFVPQTYAAKGGAYLRVLLAEMTPLGAGLALAGWLVLLRRDRRLAAALALFAVVPTAFAFGYTVEADIERYYLISFAVAAIAAGIGADAVVRRYPQSAAAAPAALAALAVGLLYANAGTFAQWHSPGAAPVIDAARQRTPADAILIAPWLYATPLAYGAYVEGSLGNRIVETAWLQDDAERVPGWTKTRPVYVVGIVFGSVPGYHLVDVGGNPAFYRVVKN